MVEMENWNADLQNVIADYNCDKEDIYNLNELRFFFIKLC